MIGMSGQQPIQDMLVHGVKKSGIRLLPDTIMLFFG